MDSFVTRMRELEILCLTQKVSTFRVTVTIIILIVPPFPSGRTCVRALVFEFTSLTFEDSCGMSASYSWHLSDIIETMIKRNY